MDKSAALTKGLTGGSPEPIEAVAAIGQALNVEWPPGFAEFLAQSGGGEGWIGESYLVVWPPGEIVANNEAMKVAEFAPNLVGFATDGGGELFAFDREYDPVHIVMVPMIGLDYPRDFGSSFSGFLSRLHSGDIPGP
jgi:SMI1 / KNR4 family (SUKH-1)